MTTSSSNLAPASTSTQCPSWCIDHSCEVHFGQPVELQAQDTIIQLGLELRDGKPVIAVVGDDLWVTRLTPAQASQLAAALATLGATAMS